MLAYYDWYFETIIEFVRHFLYLTFLLEVPKWCRGLLVCIFEGPVQRTLSELEYTSGTRAIAGLNLWQAG